MTDLHDEVYELLSPLRDGPVGLSNREEDARRRQRLLAATRAEVARVPVRRRARRMRRAGLLLGGLTAAAAALALVSSAVVMREVTLTRSDVAAPAPTGFSAELLPGEDMTWTDHGGRSHLLDRSAQLIDPRTLRTGDSTGAALRTPEGARVQLAPRTRLRTPPLDATRGGTELELLQGEVACRVPALGPDRRFSVRTPDAHVIVHGTVFSVRFEPDGASCVEVTEGRVEVVRDGARRFLGPGERWGCGGSDAERSAQQADREVKPARRASRRAGRAHREARARADKELGAPSGTLSDENRMLSAALAAERAGDDARARKLLRRLVRRFPNSPLRPEAESGLRRLR